jgi:peptide/nickel transport system substrate-binding protein
MTQQPATLATLRDDIMAGRLTRRGVLRRAAASGLIAPVIAGLLAACGDDDEPEPAATAAATSSPGGAGAATPAGSTTISTPAGVEASAESTPASGAATIGTSPGRGRGAGELLRLLIWQAPTSLNTHFSQGDKDGLAARLVLEPLVNVMADGTLEPVLADEAPSLENGGVAGDGKSVTYKLKQGVVWSDGEPFTAEDVRFTWEFVTNPDVAATTFATYDPISEVEVVDEHTITFRFAEPNPNWGSVFSGSFGGAVLPKHVLEGATGSDARSAAFNLDPIGTGPYRVTEFRPGDTVLYEINETYREADKPFFARVELKGGGDATSAARAVLLSGETDYAWNLQIEKAIAEDLTARAESGVLVATPGNSVEQLLLNFADPNEEVNGARSEPTTQHPFFSDKVVRDALRLATDSETIATELYGESGLPTANTLVAPTTFNSPNTTVEFDPDGAASLLDEAGWTMDGDVRARDGQKLSIVCTTTVNPVRQKTQEILKQTWEQIGFAVELKAIDAGVFFSSDAGNPDTVAHFYADVTMFTNGPSSPFPLDYMSAFKSNVPETDIAQQSNQWSGNNYNRWVNQEFNDLWISASAELDPVKQAELFIAMNDLVVGEVVRIGLVHRNGLSGYSKRIRGHIHSSWELAVYDIANWYAEE